MMADSADDGDSVLLLETPEATVALAARVAAISRPGDVIALHGTLGVGKTAFARGFILSLARAASLAIEEVPSPTYTLIQSYEIGPQTIHHIDLYRVETAEDALEIGLEDAFDGGICLIEWPDRLGAYLPVDALHLTLQAGQGPTERQATFSGPPDWMSRLTDTVLHG